MVVSRKVKIKIRLCFFTLSIVVIFATVLLLVVSPFIYISAEFNSANSVNSLNSLNETWTLLSSDTTSPPPISDFAMAYDSDNKKILLYGGLTCTKASCWGSELWILNETWIFDLDTNTWENLNPITSPPPLWGHQMVYDSHSKKFILFGGGKTYNYTNFWADNRSSETWEYDLPSNKWSQLLTSIEPSARFKHGMVYDSFFQKTLLFGGRINSYGEGDTWIFDYQETKWIKLNPEIIPLDRSNVWYTRSDFAMVYDSYNRKTILYGGNDAGANIHNSTWIYDSITNIWEEKTPVDGPGNRYSVKMVYDTIHSKSILFGGGTAPPEGGLVENLGDTWAYDFKNNNWEFIPMEVSPTPRYSHEMTYISVNDQVILFGGFTNHPDDVIRAPYNKRHKDLWGFNHSEDKWTSVIPTSTSSTTDTTASSTTDTTIPDSNSSTSEIKSELTSLYLTTVLIALSVIVKRKKT
ncbi:MAG: Kelch repeat-containing protein [Candidatus Hodarchaeales archaeon]|jgi:hypothetical protein